MKKVFSVTPGLTRQPMLYCPGCMHGVVHRLVAEVLVEQQLLGDAIGISPVGCAVLAHEYFNCDFQQAAHGRAPAVATGIKRVHPDKIVFTYQGDGDLASIGLGEFLHAAIRGEQITIIFINNAVFGMTGGQMAPTTLDGQKTSTTPLGRDPAQCGHPLHVSELVATIDGATFVERVDAFSPAGVRRAKKAISRAFEVQRKKLGFSFVEVLSTCPVNWGLRPDAALAWGERHMKPIYPVRNFRDPEAPAGGA